jgi:hypothetical protein
MRKSEIETHRSGYGGTAYPAINVKYYGGGCRTQDIAARFGCSDAQAEKAAQFAWESACEQFWEQAKERAAEIFGGRVKVYSAGRSGGWLILDGLPEVSEWDAVALGRYASMCRFCRDEIAYRTSVECVLEDIAANEWHKDGAELFNFVDTASGTRCIADLKQEAKAAGFAPVVRP